MSVSFSSTVFLAGQSTKSRPKAPAASDRKAPGRGGNGGGGGGAWKSYSLGHPSGKISLVEIPSSCPCCPTSPQHVKAGIGLSYRSRCRPSSTSRYALLPSVIPVEPCHPKAVSGNMLHNSKTYVYVRICIICMYVCMYIYIYTHMHIHIDRSSVCIYIHMSI